ncbi:hypothetical protein E4U43_000479, partial [Claviceps pusilla]
MPGPEPAELAPAATDQPTNVRNKETGSFENEKDKQQENEIATYVNLDGVQGNSEKRGDHGGYM